MTSGSTAGGLLPCASGCPGYTMRTSRAHAATRSRETEVFRWIHLNRVESEFVARRLWLDDLNLAGYE